MMRLVSILAFSLLILGCTKNESPNFSTLIPGKEGPVVYDDKELIVTTSIRTDSRVVWENSIIEDTSGNSTEDLILVSSKFVKQSKTAFKNQEIRINYHIRKKEDTKPGTYWLHMEAEDADGDYTDERLKFEVQ